MGRERTGRRPTLEGVESAQYSACTRRRRLRPRGFRPIRILEKPEGKNRQPGEIAGLGIDTHGVDPGRDSSFAVSKLLLEQPRIVLANLAGLDQLPPTGTTLVIGILRLRGGSGSPASVIALIP